MLRLHLTDDLAEGMRTIEEAFEEAMAGLPRSN